MDSDPEVGTLLRRRPLLLAILVGLGAWEARRRCSWRRGIRACWPVRSPSTLRRTSGFGTCSSGASPTASRDAS